MTGFDLQLLNQLCSTYNCLGRFVPEIRFACRGAGLDRLGGGGRGGGGGTTNKQMINIPLSRWARMVYFLTTAELPAIDTAKVVYCTFPGERSLVPDGARQDNNSVRHC